MRAQLAAMAGSPEFLPWVRDITMSKDNPALKLVWTPLAGATAIGHGEMRLLLRQIVCDAPPAAQATGSNRLAVEGMVAPRAGGPR
jgi:hypothetical protein